MKRLLLILVVCGIAKGQAPPTIPTGLSGPAFQTAVRNWLSYLNTSKQATLGFTAVPTTRTINGQALSSNITLDTSLIGEAGNLYFTQARARNSFYATSPIVFDPSTGQISCPTCGISVGTSSVFGRTGNVTAEFGDYSAFYSPIGHDHAGVYAPLASPTFTGTVSGITAAMVGLNNVNNTSDANKPVSTAQAAAIATKLSQGAGAATQNAVTVYDAAGAVIASGCKIASGVLTCGDGTAQSALILPELVANGTNDFRIYGAANQAADGCIVLGGSPTTGQGLVATGTTSTIDGKTCVTMAWATPTVYGDASTNTATSVDGEMPLFSGTTGKIFKRAAFTGLLYFTAGVPAVVTGTATDCVKVNGTSGTCGAGGSATPPYIATMSSSTTWSVNAATHGFATKGLLVETFDSSGNRLQPNTVNVDPSTYAVTVTWNTAQAGVIAINGGTGPAGASTLDLNLATGDIATSQIKDSAVTPAKVASSLRIRPCEIHIWGTGTAGALQDTDDEPYSCYNEYGATLTITSLKCRVDNGTTTTVNVINTGGATILNGASMTAGNGTAASGSIITPAPTQAANTTLDIQVLAHGTANSLICVVGRTL